jgi:hypothetical protein
MLWDIFLIPSGGWIKHKRYQITGLSFELHQSIKSTNKGNHGCHGPKKEQ